MTAYELDHLAIAIPRWTDARAYLGETLGGRWLSGFRVPGFSPGLVGFESDMRLELLEPGTDDESFVQRFLDARGGAAPHHITFKVPDIEESIRRAEDNGIRPILVRIDNDQWREAFLHPSDTGLGFLTQMVQANFDPASGGAAMGAAAPAWTDRDTPAAPRAIPALVGVVPDWSGPLAALVHTLGAEMTELSPRVRRFRWPEGADLILELDASEGAPHGVQAVLLGAHARQDLDLSDLERATPRHVDELGLTFCTLAAAA